MGLRAAGIRRDPHQFRRVSQVLRQDIPADIQQSEIVSRLGIAELGRGREQFRRLLAIDRPAASGKPKHGEFKHRLAVAGVRSALVPSGSLGVVALDTEAVGIQFAEHGHGLRIAVFLHALGREIEGGLVETALIGAVDQIGIGIIGGGAGVAVAAAGGAGAGGGFLAAGLTFGFAAAAGFASAAPGLSGAAGLSGVVAGGASDTCAEAPAVHITAARISAAHLKFLHRQRQIPSRNFKWESGPGIMILLVPMTFRRS